MRRAFVSGLTACAMAWAVGIPSAMAHTALHRVLDTPGVTVEFGYSDGSSMAAAEVRVFAPGQKATPRQVGRTDADGRFAFLPNADGVWTVSARDEDGHVHDAEVKISGGVASSGSWWRRAVLFGSIFLNVALIAFLVELRRGLRSGGLSGLMTRFIGRSRGAMS